MPRADDEPGLPLSHFRDQHPGSGVEVWCMGCQLARAWPIESVISLLGEAKGVRRVAASVRHACPRCGGRRFGSRPLFPTQDFKPFSDS